MFWGLKRYPFGGPMIQRFGEEYHLFSTTLDTNEQDQSRRTVLHAVSRDMVQWERRPDALGVGPKGAFDGYTLYDINVVEQDGRYYMHYTGLDKPMGPGQKQAIGVALSKDLVHWERYQADPVLCADPRFYEQAVPREATYQEKDFDRLWFRDPWVFRDPASGTWGMLVGARDVRSHPDVRGCLAYATSNDLLHWTPHPPLFSPERFHTLECPCLFVHNGIHYLTFLTHPGWGMPFLTGDPYQTYGNFYAFSKNGLLGDWCLPRDCVAVASMFVRRDGVARGRMGGLKTVTGSNGCLYAYYTCYAAPAAGDDTSDPLADGVSAPKRLVFRSDGSMAVAFNPDTAGRYGAWQKLPHDAFTAAPLRPPWRLEGGAVRGKNLQGRSVILGGATPGHAICSTRVTFIHGERAGLLLRCGGEDGPGWQVVLDRRWQRVEFGLVGQGAFIGARRWEAHADTVELKLALWGPSIEIYVDDVLMFHQVRYRETSGRLGLLVERGEAIFAPL